MFTVYANADMCFATAYVFLYTNNKCSLYINMHIIWYVSRLFLEKKTKLITLDRLR